jgi:hypothetical protein
MWPWRGIVAWVRTKAQIFLLVNCTAILNIAGKDQQLLTAKCAKECRKGREEKQIK